MPFVNGLVPARFLTLTAHLVIVITIFWSRESNVRASLPLQCTQEEYENRDTEMVVALSVTLGLFAVELGGFLSGVSMFNNAQSLLSTGAHASAAAALLFFLFEQWDSSLYWWILAFCRILRETGKKQRYSSCKMASSQRGQRLRSDIWKLSCGNGASTLAAHCSASICLSFFVFERWETAAYWYIMSFCSALPAAVEVFLLISVFGLKKKPL